MFVNLICLCQVDGVISAGICTPSATKVGTYAPSTFLQASALRCGDKSGKLD